MKRNPSAHRNTAPLTDADVRRIRYYLSEGVSIKRCAVIFRRGTRIIKELKEQIER